MKKHINKDNNFMEQIQFTIRKNNNMIILNYNLMLNLKEIIIKVKIQK